MTDGIHGANFQAHFQQAVSDNGQRADARGEYKGQAVVHSPESALSLIQDAAEELTFAQSETVSKKLADRKNKSKDANTTAAELAAKYVQAIKDIGQPEKLNQLTEALKKAGAATPEEVQRQLEEFFDDVSHQFVGLEFVEELLTSEDANSELLAAVKQAKSNLEAAHGPEIRSGINVTDRASDFAGNGLAEVPELREFYRESILGYEGINQAYDSILDRYGIEKFDDAAEFLIQSIGDDIHAAGPSIDPQQLKATLDDLYFVQVARNTQQQFGTLLTTMQSEFGVAGDADPHELMKEILPLKDQRWVDGSKITSLVDRLGITEDEPKIYCLRELHGIVRGLPMKVFNEPEDRMRLATAVQDALDVAIEDEL